MYIVYGYIICRRYKGVVRFCLGRIFRVEVLAGVVCFLGV